MKYRVAVLGAGSWGTALAQVLAENGHDVRLWGHRQSQIDERWQRRAAFCCIWTRSST